MRHTGGHIAPAAITRGAVSRSPAMMNDLRARQMKEAERFRTLRKRLRGGMLLREPHRVKKLSNQSMKIGKGAGPDCGHQSTHIQSKIVFCECLTLTDRFHFEREFSMVCQQASALRPFPPCSTRTCSLQELDPASKKTHSLIINWLLTAKHCLPLALGMNRSREHLDPWPKSSMIR